MSPEVSAYWGIVPLVSRGIIVFTPVVSFFSYVLSIFGGNPILHVFVDIWWGESSAVVFHFAVCPMGVYFWRNWSVDIWRGHSLLCLFGVLCHTVDILSVPASYVMYVEF